jgi:hypothetical protein
MGVQLLKAQERQKTLFIFFLESKVGLLHFFSSLVRYSFSSTLRSTKFCCLQKKTDGTENYHFCFGGTRS